VPSTLSGVCNETGASTCKAAMKCSVSVTQSQCIQSFVAGCCGNAGTCDQAVSGVSESSYKQCNDGLASMTCTDLMNTNLPTACEGI
jgi:hypothetical protein